MQQNGSAHKDDKKVLSKNKASLINRAIILEKLFNSNWNFVGTLKPNEREALEKVLAMHSCPTSRVSHLSPQGDVYLCGSKVLPPVENLISGEVFQEGLEVVDAFNLAGPIGVARYCGVSQDKIKEVLFDKGPCGLCNYAVKQK